MMKLIAAATLFAATCAAAQETWSPPLARTVEVRPDDPEIELPFQVAHRNFKRGLWTCLARSMGGQMAIVGTVYPDLRQGDITVYAAPGPAAVAMAHVEVEASARGSRFRGWINKPLLSEGWPEIVRAAPALARDPLKPDCAKLGFTLAE